MVFRDLKELLEMNEWSGLMTGGVITDGSSEGKKPRHP